MTVSHHTIVLKLRMRQSIIVQKSHIALLDRSIGNKGDSTSQSTRQSLSLLHDELAATKKLLHLQQQDNYKCHDHIHILDSEIDSLHKLLDEKQRVINHLTNVTTENNDKIKELDLLVQKVTEAIEHTC